MYFFVNFLECDQSVDLTRVPGDCSKFYRCSNGRLFTLECPEDTVFDNKYKVCNYPLNVEDECGYASPSMFNQLFLREIPNDKIINL